MSSTAVTSETKAPASNLSAFKYPAFRLYFGGQLVSVSGTWMQAIAQQIVVYNLTKSELTLGLVACAQGLPALLLTPFAGVIVERFPRRQILILTQTMMMILAFIQAYLQFANILQVWHIVALSIGLGFANALDAPARQAFVVEMVGKEDLASGIVLNSIMFNAARIIGPALGGLALRVVGPAWCFFLNGMSFVAVIISLAVMIVPHVERASGRLSMLQPLKEGFQFARTHPTIRPLLLMSAITSVFGITFSVLIPSFADHVLHDTQLGTAALTTANGIGAVLAGLAVAKANSTGRRGQVVVLAAIASPIFVLIFALTTSYFSALPLIGLAGFSFISQFVLMNTLLQTQVPDEFRGRVLSLYTLTFFGLSPFGNLAIGVIAEEMGTIPAFLIYGAICLVATALVVWRAPQLRRLM